MRTLRSFLFCLVLLPPATLAAQADSARTPAMVTRGDLARLGLVAGLAGATYAIDPDMRRWAQRPALQESGLADGAARFGDAWGGFVAFSTGLALWGGGLLAREPTVATIGLRALEAVTVSGIIAGSIKAAAGRVRPRVAPHTRDEFGLMRGVSDGDHRSLPSGHVTAAFAFAAAVTSEVADRAPRHARTVAVVSYALGAVTAYDRLHADAHWMSDIVLGAGLGIVSGWAVTRWHRARPENWVDRRLLRPVISTGADGGTRLGVTLCLP